MNEIELNRIEASVNIDHEGQLKQFSKTIDMPQDEIKNAETNSNIDSPQVKRLKEQEEKMVKLKKKIGFMLLFGLFFILFGGTALCLWPSLFNDVFNKELILTPNSTSFKMWKVTPVPMYLKIHLYNWTNYNEIMKNTSLKPHFEQMGPYVFRERDYKIIKNWNNNGTVTFQQKRVWNFVPSMSNGSLSDRVTNLNPIAATIVYAIRNQIDLIKHFLNKALNRIESIIITTTVREILFDGYDDPILELAAELKRFIKIPYGKFAWFYKRNNSESYDGTFNMLTGSNNMYNLGIIKEWNYNKVSPHYSNTCGEIQGTNGDLWPPLLNNQTVSVFSPDICTSLTLNYVGTSDWLGLAGSKFVSTEDMFDNGTRIESRKCYCKNVECQPSGTLNVSPCKFGAPAFVSLPHFYLADESYRQNITGMNPNKEDHEFILVVQPNTGIPMQVRASLQINFLVKPEKSYSYFKDLPTMYVPMMWFTQEVNLTSEYAKQVKILMILPPLVNGVLFSLLAVGILLLLFSGFIYFRQKLKKKQSENLLPKDSTDKDTEVHDNNEE